MRTFGYYGLSLRIAAVLASTLLTASFSPAAIIISEVDPSGSSATSNTYNADWFELTNTGASAVDITGWKMDDNSHTFGSAVALRGVTSIAPGKSVVFVEGLADGSTDATIDAAFESFWFGASIPAGFTIGNYGGTGVGLSQTADEVNIYDSTGADVVGVGFNAATVGVSFDNAAGLGNSTQPDTIISMLSAVGVNGTFISANAATGQSNEIGSPGVISSVPEPGSALLLCLGSGLLTITQIVRCRRVWRRP
jgi:hypothetical protein